MIVEFNSEWVSELKAREDAAFLVSHPRSLELRERARASMPFGVPMTWMATLYDHAPLYVDSGDGATFTDVDGHRYIDFSLGITVASCGHTPEPVIRAVEDRIARGTQFQLPTRGRDLPVRGARPALGPPQVAVRAELDAGRHRRDPARADPDRPRAAARLRGQVPRERRRDARDASTATGSRPSTTGSRTPTSRAPSSRTGTTWRRSSAHSPAARSPCCSSSRC